MDGQCKWAVAALLLATVPAPVVSAQRITATWQGQHLATALERIAGTAHAALWIDRRVDPRQEVDAQLTNVSVEQALTELAAQHDLGFAQWEGVFYVGPKRTARALTTLSQQARAALRHVPPAQGKRWLQAESWSWPRLSQPRALLADLVREAHARLVDGELVPHDLWPARELPPLALVDRVVLVLAGFDLTCEISPDGKTCRVVPIQYPRQIAGDGSPSRAPSEAPPPSGAHTRKQFSLRLKNQPVGRVLEQLAQQLRLEVTWNEASLRARKVSRETLVSCDVAEADLDGLLRGILEPAGMTFTRQGRRVEIRALR